MRPACDDAQHQPRPLGSVMACGCVVRAAFLSCDDCGTEQWVATPTDVPVGDVVAIRGLCGVCGASIGQMVPVHERPAPSTFRR